MDGGCGEGWLHAVRARAFRENVKTMQVQDTRVLGLRKRGYTVVRIPVTESVRRISGMECAYVEWFCDVFLGPQVIRADSNTSQS